MADLGSSLTKMDWLHKLGVGEPIVTSGFNGFHDTVDALGQSPGLAGAQGSPDPPGSHDHTGSTSQKDGKPPYSYASLIMHAINSTINKRMTLSEIYAWICDNFPYYKDVGNGWKVCMVIMFVFFLRCIDQQSTQNRSDLISKKNK